MRMMLTEADREEISRVPGCIYHKSEPTVQCEDDMKPRMNQKDHSAYDPSQSALSKGWFAARQPGVCSRCRRPFGVGTPIRRCLDDDVKLVGWGAECCPPADQSGQE